MNIGNLLNIERENQGLSYRELSKLSGVPHTTIQNWETSNANMRVPALDKVLSALGINYTIGTKN